MTYRKKKLIHWGKIIYFLQQVTKKFIQNSFAYKIVFWEKKLELFSKVIPLVFNYKFWTWCGEGRIFLPCNFGFKWSLKSLSSICLVVACASFLVNPKMWWNKYNKRIMILHHVHVKHMHTYILEANIKGHILKMSFNC
jgi:hypothetical protein